MSCPICHFETKNYRCNKCKLAMIPHQKKTGKKLYSFKNYKTQEKYLEKKLTSLAKIVIKFVQKGRLLDIGAGFGQFSAILNRLGKYKIELVEPSVKPEYLTNKKIKTYKKIYEEFLKLHPTGVKLKFKYDLIMMMDILEHFKNPVEILEKTKKLLPKNGYLVIQTPNYRSLMAKVCKNWSWWMVEDHKLIFSPKSIKLILKKTGYKIVYFKTYEDLYDFKKNLDGNFTNKFNKGIFYLIFFPFYLIFRPLLWYFGYGGAIFLIAKQYNRN